MNSACNFYTTVPLGNSSLLLNHCVYICIEIRFILLRNLLTIYSISETEKLLNSFYNLVYLGKTVNCSILILPWKKNILSWGITSFLFFFLYFFSWCQVSQLLFEFLFQFVLKSVFTKNPGKFCDIVCI